jgi:hypothetical protein
MVWKTGQFLMCSAIIPTREHDPQNFGSPYRVFSESLIKIAYPEKQQRARVLGFDLIVLFIKRSFFVCLCQLSA